MKFLKGFFVFILIAIIIGGVGYIGYSFLFMNHSAYQPDTLAAQAERAASTANKSVQNTQNMQGVQGMSGMQQDSSTNQSQQNGSQQSANNQAALDQSNLALQNKDQLNQSISTLNEALRLLSLDPYAPSSNNSDSMNKMQSQQGATVQTQPADAQTQPSTAQGNNTTINIYPQSSTPNAQQGTMNVNGGMSNMGTTYDANKMEQLHAGLYKMSLGMTLLDQLNNELISQAGNTSINVQNLAQFYTYQYNLMVQNKNKLSQAITYINEAANLVNINPYVSSTGLVYDKDKMGQLHQSVYKMAAGVASLNLLSDDFTKQSVTLSNTTQNYIYSAAGSMVNMSANMSSNMSNGLFGGVFDNINAASAVNIILIVFVIGLIFGIFGFIFSLLKGNGKKAAKKENEYASHEGE